MSLTSVASADGEPALEGTVQDITKGAIVGAIVRVDDGKGEHAETVTDARGEYRFSRLPPGRYALTADYPGFASARRTVTVRASQPARADVTLEIELEDQVTVADTVSLHDSPLTRTLTRQELALLPNDSRLLLQRLREMAGTRGVQGDVTIYVDGFREGLRVPPKESIEMVRISAHPFSAEFQEPGHARIEITSRPGAETVKADVSASFNSDDLNAQDYFAPAKPESELRHFTGYVAAPLVRKKLGFTAFAGRWSEDANDVFNATVLGAGGNPESLSGVVGAPTQIDSVLAGVNSLAGRRHTLRLLYGLNQRREQNQGIDTAFDLPERGYSRSTRETSARGSLLSILAPNFLNEAHVELSRRDYGHAAASDAPATIVLDAFHAGGNQNALFMDERTNGVQVRDTVSYAFGRSMLKAGVQAEHASSRVTDRGGFGGTFLFGADVERGEDGRPLRDENGQPTSISPLERYRRTVLALPGYGPSQFSIVTGNPELTYRQWWLSWFAQNDWTVRPGMTVSFGVRQEWQTHVSRRGEFAARSGLGWTLDSAGRNTIRGGAGVFFSRIGPELTLDTTRYDGRHQLEYFVNQPATYPQAPAIETGRPPAIHTKAPDLKVPYTVVATASYERQLPGNVVAVVEYAHERGDRLLLRRNINAPGIDGMLPLPGSGPVLEYASLGESRSHQLLSSLRLNLEKRLTIMGGYQRTWSRATTDGFRTAPANPDDLSMEWGMPVSDREHRGHLGATFYLPWDVFVSPYVTASSGLPFNITTGRDANGDTLYSERPGLAAAGDPEAIWTPMGFFTLSPGDGQIVPRNFGRGETEIRFDLHVSKLTRLVGGVKLTLAADVQNALNRGVFSAYNSVVTSPLFGEPNRSLPARRVLLTARLSY